MIVTTDSGVLPHNHLSKLVYFTTNVLRGIDFLSWTLFAHQIV